MAAGMNRSFRLVLGNPEAPGHGDVVFLVFIPPEPQGAWCGWELIAWENPELSKATHGMATAPIIRIAIKPVIPNAEDFPFQIHGVRYLSALLSARDALLSILTQVYCALLFMGHA
jgi:hypothetical protein